MGTPPPPEQGTTIADQAQIPRLDQLCTALVVANLVRGSGRSKAAAWLETFVSHFGQQIHTFSAPPMLKQPFWRCSCRPGVGHVSATAGLLDADEDVRLRPKWKRMPALPRVRQVRNQGRKVQDPHQKFQAVSPELLQARRKAKSQQWKQQKQEACCLDAA